MTIPSFSPHKTAINLHEGPSHHGEGRFQQQLSGGGCGTWDGGGGCPGGRHWILDGGREARWSSIKAGKWMEMGGISIQILINWYPDIGVSHHIRMIIRINGYHQSISIIISEWYQKNGSINDIDDFNSWGSQWFQYISIDHGDFNDDGWGNA